MARSWRISWFLAWSVAGLAGCADPTSAPRAETTASPRVAIIGWDGATWDVIDPLLRRGELPNLARLLDDGGRAVLRAENPLLSPVLWTTLATGFGPAEHGITDFQLPDPNGGGLILASAFHRRRAPLWKMVSAAGGSVGVVGWWTTWPAEPVTGYMVSDHLAYNRWDAWARRPEGTSFHLTYPPELAGELSPVAVRPEALDAATLLALAPFDEERTREMMEATKPVKFHGPSVLRFGYATDASNAAFTRHLLETRPQPDLLAVVFILSDVAGHVFWHHYEPGRFPRGASSGDLLGEAVPNIYRRLDRWTGEIVDRLEPGTHVIVLSDHGMRAIGRLPRPGINPSGDHDPNGVLVISGGAVPAHADLGVLDQVDVAPTVLALLGLPVANDMPGRVLAAALPEGTAPERIASYGEGRFEQWPDERSPGEDELEERLRSLGYIQ